ncbi:hypothetical protein JCM19275_1056 [Nonlabens ulvanivorans]|uniref:DinB-like domain-containing protein n=1 Tax=Nonlabens ulvanivorans TaxID=906888 RepID=A0A090X2X0_NONUL|nr:hypothetical protein JCM19275_1056 [Nonlabens ulvanivorans]
MFLQMTNLPNSTNIFPPFHLNRLVQKCLKPFYLLLFTLSMFNSVSLKAQELNLDKEFHKIESYLMVMDEANLEVSEAPVKWHLFHSLQVINGVLKEAEHSNPDEYNSKTNFQWRFVSVFNKIPRNKVTAPDKVNPSYNITKKQILEELKKARKSIEGWRDLEKNNFYKHAVLMNLNKRKIRKFLRVHSRHHLKIIQDILKK